MKLLFIFAVGAAVGFLVGRRFAASGAAAHTPAEPERDAGNLAGANEERRKRVEADKAKITALLRTQTEIRNNDVEKLLSVSDATATRYLNELEAEGTVVQIGDSGRGVSYRLK